MMATTSITENHAATSSSAQAKENELQRLRQELLRKIVVRETQRPSRGG